MSRRGSRDLGVDSKESSSQKRNAAVKKEKAKNSHESEGLDTKMVKKQKQGREQEQKREVTHRDISEIDILQVGECQGPIGPCC